MSKYKEQWVLRFWSITIWFRFWDFDQTGLTVPVRSFDGWTDDSRFFLLFLTFSVLKENRTGLDMVLSWTGRSGPVFKTMVIPYFQQMTLRFKILKLIHAPLRLFWGEVNYFGMECQLSWSFWRQSILLKDWVFQV